MPDGDLGVVDVGGGSSEMVVGSPPDVVRWSASFGLGSGELTESRLHSDPPSESELADARDRDRAGAERARGAAPGRGGRRRRQRRVAPALAGSLLDADAFSRSLRLLASEPARVIARRFDLHIERVRLLPAGLLILQAAAELFAAPLRVGIGGIREGILLEAAGG